MPAKPNPKSALQLRPWRNRKRPISRSTYYRRQRLRRGYAGRKRPR